MITPKNDNFFIRVYEVAKLIPHGKITTYGAIAKYVGAPKSARMVGWAMNKAFMQNEFIPAHRVVNRNGLLTGKNYFGGKNTMQELLKSEGIDVENDKIINFSKYYWEPI